MEVEHLIKYNVSSTLQVRNDTIDNWMIQSIPGKGANRVLAKGEIGWVTGTSDFKIGDGITPFKDLKWIKPESLNSEYAVKLGNESGSYTYIQLLNELSKLVTRDEFESKLGKPDGIATLGSDGKVPSSQLPSFVDDVIEVPTYSNLPEVGESSKIYVVLDTNKTYRWSGSQYIELSESIALGYTHQTAFYGDEGKATSDLLSTHIDAVNPHGITKELIGLENVDNTHDSDKHVAYSDITPWSGVEGKPTEFKPEAHTHSYTELTGSTDTPNQVIVSTGLPNQWELRNLDKSTIGLSNVTNDRQMKGTDSSTPSNLVMFGSDGYTAVDSGMSTSELSTLVSQASDSARSARESASNAAISESNAQRYMTQSAQSSSDAQSSASEAKIYSESAEVSESNALSYMSDSSTYSDSARLSSANALISEANSKEYEELAKRYSENAGDKADEAYEYMNSASRSADSSKEYYDKATQLATPIDDPTEYDDIYIYNGKLYSKIATNVDHNKLINLPTLNGSPIIGSYLLDSSLAITDKVISVADGIVKRVRISSTAQWDVEPSYIPENGQIIIYSDYMTIDNVKYAGIKIGDGSTKLLNLPFVCGDLRSKVDTHISDSLSHVSAADREYWNSKNRVSEVINNETLIITL